MTETTTDDPSLLPILHSLAAQLDRHVTLLAAVQAQGTAPTECARARQLLDTLCTEWQEAIANQPASLTLARTWLRDIQDSIGVLSYAIAASERR